MSGSSSATAMRSDRFMGLPRGKVMRISAPGGPALAERRSGRRGPRRSAWRSPCPGRSPWSWWCRTARRSAAAAPGRAPGRCRGRRRGGPAGRRGRLLEQRISISTGSRQAARAFSRTLRKTCPRRNGSTAQRRSTPSTSLPEDGAAGPRAGGSRCAQASRQTSPRSQARRSSCDRGRVARGRPRRGGGGGPGPSGCRAIRSSASGRSCTCRASISRQAWLRCRALRLSWARPATIWPMAASRSACKARSWACFSVGDVLADHQEGRAALVVGQGPGVPDHPAARAVPADDRVLESAAWDTRRAPARSSSATARRSSSGRKSAR